MSGLPWYAILRLPVLSAADNLTITGLSVAVALIIGTVELLGLIADQADLHGPFWDRVSGLDLNLVGYVIGGLFLATWAVAPVVWKVGRIEERWTSGLAKPELAESKA
ncbi:hypothetical protein GCM10023084_54800 [Streptomyces lacrimifluminis]|uniref:Nickel/cobalt efflux system n=1 Tax=Streptomyces lacrimifluminis TaxID=1500077 RepID=A0A917NX57_9ACTN|nr:hypothetical protein GCM10012282_33060 [Streptomyces lacrimifluminis]